MNKLTQKIQRLQAEHGESLARRRRMAAELHGLCTGPGDRRFRILHKERLENRILNYTEAELDRRSRELNTERHPGVEARIELLLVEMARIDRGSNQAHVRLQTHQVELARFQEEVRYFQQAYEEAELTATMARQSLQAAKAERITLN